MRDVLVPIFGEWGAVVVQFLLTVVIVLGLIGLAVWFIRRYSGVRFGGIGRGRVPRLAVIDALPVDRRRRLVLVRRDNVEHLLLIGGPGDVVVETGIQRVRQRSPQQAAQVAAARAAAQPTPDAPAALQAPAVQRPAGNEPIPFPLARNGQPRPAPANDRRAPRAIEPPAPPVAPPPPPEPPEAEPYETPVAETAYAEPYRITPQPFFAPPPRPEEAPEPQPADMAPAAEADIGGGQPAPAPGDEAEADEVPQPPLDLGETEAPATASGDELPPSDDEADKVGDLEREMARLLDEISTRRSS